MPGEDADGKGDVWPAVSGMGLKGCEADLSLCLIYRPGMSCSWPHPLLRSGFVILCPQHTCLACGAEVPYTATDGCFAAQVLEQEHPGHCNLLSLVFLPSRENSSFAEFHFQSKPYSGFGESTGPVSTDKDFTMQIFTQGDKFVFLCCYCD